MDLERLFHPRSIAVVGASPNLGGGKLPYYQLLKSSGYAGELYPVNPAHREIDGVRVHASLDELPDGLDLVIVSVPVRLALETLRSAVRKQVKFVHFFTSGFSEIGDAELEDAMVRAAREGGTRIVGPNCVGVLCAESKLTFSVAGSRAAGAGSAGVAFLGQSGGVSIDFVNAARSRGIGLSKAVSYGNQIDLRVGDFLAYLAGDDRVTAVAAYIEDVKDGRGFLHALREATARKPVIILKGGATEPGARAAASHTGAMAGSYEVFSAAVRQQGAIGVETFEELLQVVMLATSYKLPAGPRLGFLGAGGGTSVLLTDAASRHGLSLPELEERTQARIRASIADVNTSATNPVDLGAFGLDFGVMTHTMQALDEDPNVDVVVPFFSMDFLARFFGKQTDSGIGSVLETAGAMVKPVIPIVSKSTEDDLRIEEHRIQVVARLREARLAVYGTIEDAIQAIACVCDWRDGVGSRMEHPLHP